MIREKEDFFIFQNDVFLSHRCMIYAETSKSCSLLDSCLFCTHTETHTRVHTLTSLYNKEKQAMGRENSSDYYTYWFYYWFCCADSKPRGCWRLTF